MILYIIRHAWAGHYGDPEWPDDFQRPLTPKGRKRFAKMVDLLVAEGFAPQAVATSPLVRCRQTAEVVAQRSPGEPRLTELDSLAPGSDLGALLEWTVEQTGDCEQVAWVGHAPDVGHLTAALIGDREGWLRFRKGAVAAVEFDGPPAPGEGELRFLATAKTLDC